MTEDKSEFENITVEPENVGFSRGADIGSFSQPKPYMTELILPEEEKTHPKTKEDVLKELGSIMLEQDKSMDYLNAIQRAIDIIK